MPLDLEQALSDALEHGASDLHIKVPSPPRIRVQGELRELPGHEPVRAEDTAALRDRIIDSELKRRQLEQHGSTDLSYYTPFGRFRVAAFTQRGQMSFVFRAIPTAPDTATLGLPSAVMSWADEKRGLVVITGPTGSGKSTTCAALLDFINRRRSCHILTIEDPIEYLHRDLKALVSQREIGLDAENYLDALRAALRQDPDVILVGEVRDEETAMTALRAAETGHLVLCTMHTVDAAETVQRFVDLFGEGRAELARQMLSASLVGICSQRLVPNMQDGRALNAEVLVNSARIRDLIATSAMGEVIRTAIAEGEYYGMRTFDQNLLAHVREGRVAAEEAIAYASEPHDFRLMMNQAGLVVAA